MTIAWSRESHYAPFHTMHQEDRNTLSNLELSRCTAIEFGSDRNACCFLTHPVMADLNSEFREWRVRRTSKSTLKGLPLRRRVENHVPFNRHRRREDDYTMKVATCWWTHTYSGVSDGTSTALHCCAREPSRLFRRRRWDVRLIEDKGMRTLSKSWLGYS